MDWVQIIDADVKAMLTDYEWNAITAVPRASGASSVLDVAKSTAVLQVRGYVESCAANTLGPAGYVPALLYGSTLAFVLRKLATSVPAGTLVLDDNRQRLITDAVNELKMVARCQLRISGPGSDQETAADSPTPDTGGYGGDDPVSFSGIR